MLEIMTTEEFMPASTLECQLRMVRHYGSYVECDDNCQAPYHPILPEDYVAAYQHWRFHARDGGCTHGC
jgi:hypothetical protein